MGIKKFASEGGVHVPPSKSVYFFALPSMNGPLPAELKFRENTGQGSFTVNNDRAVRTF